MIKLYFKKIKFLYWKNKFPYRSYTHKHNAIFIHIPKTAGTSILKNLMGDKIRRDHLTYRTFQQAQSYLFDSYYKFCFVRNPFDRLVSAYEYLKKGGNQNSDLYFKNLIDEKYPTFDSFVLNYLDHDKIHSQLLLKPQYVFIFNEKDECMVDFIGRFENINNDFDVISKKLNIVTELKKTNSSDRVSYVAYYQNSDVKNKVVKLYRKDFELLGYITDL